MKTPSQYKHRRRQNKTGQEFHFGINGNSFVPGPQSSSSPPLKNEISAPPGVQGSARQGREDDQEPQSLYSLFSHDPPGRCSPDLSWWGFNGFTQGRLAAPGGSSPQQPPRRQITGSARGQAFEASAGERNFNERGSL